MGDSQLASDLEHLVAQLNRAGIAATTDPRDLTAPGAWVTIARITETVLCGELAITASVCLVTSDSGAPLAVDQLGDMLDTARQVIDITEAKPATISPPGRAPLPALVIETPCNPSTFT